VAEVSQLDHTTTAMAMSYDGKTSKRYSGPGQLVF